MSFGSLPDAPNQIKTEGEEIKVSFKPGLPTDTQGTVQWNLPSSVDGCNSSTATSAYCGIVIVLKTTNFQPTESPVDGQRYIADISANNTTHAGDKIGDGLIVGAFYEGNKKSRGEELTQSLIVQDLDIDAFYYVMAYAVDCQGRYHSSGSAAYSRDLLTPEDTSTPSSQVIDLPDGTLPSDGTHLLAGVEYKFDINLDENFPNGPTTTIPIVIQGEDAGTYQELLDIINSQIGLVNNPDRSPVPPNTGRYVVNGNDVSEYNGIGLQPITPLIVETTDPTIIAVGSIWEDNTTTPSVVKRYDGNDWIVQDYIKAKKPPSQLTCGDVWFDSNTSFTRCENTWCENETSISDNSPLSPLHIHCGQYWFETTSNTLNVFDANDWSPVEAITWDEDPTLLSPLTFWFDDSTQTLYERLGSEWVITVVTIDVEPEKIDNNIMFTTLSEELVRWDEALNGWIQLQVLVWGSDPTDRSMCNLWWRSTDDVLLKWDDSINGWVQQTLISSTRNPQYPIDVGVGHVWKSPTQTQIYNGNTWDVINIISSFIDPATPTEDYLWVDSSLGDWYISALGVWSDIDPIQSQNDPLVIPNGTMWLNPTSQSLYQRLGAAWISIPFSTADILPDIGSQWYDTTNSILKEWNGDDWIDAQLPITAEFADEGLVFSSQSTGSTVCVMIPTPGNTGVVGTGMASFGENANGASYGTTHHGMYGDTPIPETTVNPDDFVFAHIPGIIIQPQRYGTDGISTIPSYDQIDVGDDGTPDERIELMDSIMRQLGHPTVEVELTPYQLDTAIQSALETLRQRSAIAYKRGFFFLDVKGGQQRYELSNKQIGYHRIVTVTSAHRFTSAFLGMVHGSGAYGQMMLQQLYSGGTYDLTSYHLMSQYVEQLEHLFATRLTFNWDETNRTLDFFHSFGFTERVLLDCSVERTEQELLRDRWTKTWIEKWAMAKSRIMLAEVRGKFASLPGAGGGVQMNSQELNIRADKDMDECLLDLDDYVVNDIESWGIGSTMVIG